MNTVRILSTKKLEAAQQELLLNKGFGLVQADFIKTDILPIEISDIHSNIIITSQNGVKSIVKNGLTDTLRAKNIFCVGSKTAEALTQQNLWVSHTFENAAEMAQYIVENNSHLAFTYFCGNLRRKELPEILQKKGIVLQEVIAYKTLFAPQLIAGTYDGVLFFSPSLVESYFFNNSLENGTAFCIGKTTANAVSMYTNNVVIANRPTVENVIVQVVNYFGINRKHFN